MTFQKGNKLASKRRSRRTAMPRLLRAMRAVFEQEESQDRGEDQKVCREVLKEDRWKFLDKLNAMERDYAKAVNDRRGKDDDNPTGSDPGTGASLALVEELLKKWKTSTQ